jgi:hypothetical protein
MMEFNVRESIIEIIKKEIIGPNPIDLLGYRQSDGEEILFMEPPRIKYSAGILYPQESMNEELKDIEGYENRINDEISTFRTVVDDSIIGSGSNEIALDSEEVVNLANSFNQSAISITVSCKANAKISVSVSAATYVKKIEKDALGKNKYKFYRRPIGWSNGESVIKLPTSKEKVVRYGVQEKKNDSSGLEFIITNRGVSDNGSIYTFSLINVHKKVGQISDEDCYFQVGFKLKNKNGFLELPTGRKSNLSDDEATNALLYRNEKNYAVGHGCSADWCDDATEIWTEIIPTYDLKPILPTSINNVTLGMKLMSDVGDFDESINELEQLASEYEMWINRIRDEAKQLDAEYKKTADRHIQLCDESLRRIQKGINLLKTDSNVKKAFQLMNRSMLLQQLHYNLPTSYWESKSKDAVLLKAYDRLPEIGDEKTWFGDKSRYGKWRPFQLAFILMNLVSMNDSSSKDREIVDLIWFPTGGGKTEAYLGLSAFTIFLRRLKDKDNAGTTILMRYTLRLLTAQQYQRAASLICSCEMIRKEIPELLGEERISIGLWVGNTTTPSNMADAVKQYQEMYKGKSSENHFIVLKCPWCGAQMGFDSNKRIQGYKKIVTPKKKVIFQCSNNDCCFSQKSNSLPLSVIDEEIYLAPPTLLLGTVDKFAMLPFRPEAQSIFGIGCGWNPPELIIQDELHLISGPLGTMVGHYETLVHELCTRTLISDNSVKPKVIASTATISNAKEQCHALYNCGKNNVKQFPPMGLDAGDSFFAKRDDNAQGRRYVGILAPASSSFAMTNIRLYATLLYAAKEVPVRDEAQRDPYWTNLGYYNSLRELGQTATWVNADIEEYLHTIYGRKYDKSRKNEITNRRYIYRFEELTSRISNDKIPQSLENLNIRYPDSEAKAVDICLATNMVSVGVDVPRLGLMTVVGQPKTTSEYIQATSRVGRSKDAPGLVFITYSPNKPRDKSHYEQFKAYHMKIYSQVEPTSVTPFSERVRERALHAVIIGLVRLYGDKGSYFDPRVLPSDEIKNKIADLILNRVRNIEPDELQGTEELINYVFKHWETFRPQEYHTFVTQENPVLMYPSSMTQHIDWNDIGFSTPTSMRNVDSMCEIKIAKIEVNE